MKGILGLVRFVGQDWAVLSMLKSRQIFPCIRHVGWGGHTSSKSHCVDSSGGNTSGVRKFVSYPERRLPFQPNNEVFGALFHIPNLRWEQIECLRAWWGVWSGGQPFPCSDRNLCSDLVAGCHFSCPSYHPPQQERLTIKPAGQCLLSLVLLRTQKMF